MIASATPRTACASIACRTPSAPTPVCQQRANVGGGDRAISDWGNGNQAPRCMDNAMCTADETCEQVPVIGLTICELPCGANQLCPNGFTCCDLPGAGQTFRLPSNNQLAFLCGGG
ncbi:MAG: hypothetical protein R3F43_11210 [bacterium]